MSPQITEDPLPFSSPPPRRSARRRFKSIPEPSLSPEVSARVLSKGKRRATTPEDAVVSVPSTGSECDGHAEPIRKKARLIVGMDPLSEGKRKGAVNTADQGQSSVSAAIPTSSALSNVSNVSNVFAPWEFSAPLLVQDNSGPWSFDNPFDDHHTGSGSTVSGAPVPLSFSAPKENGHVLVALNTDVTSEAIIESGRRMKGSIDEFMRAHTTVCEKFTRIQHRVGSTQVPVTVARGSEEYTVLLEGRNEEYGFALVEMLAVMNKIGGVVGNMGNQVQRFSDFASSALRDVKGLQ